MTEQASLRASRESGGNRNSRLCTTEACENCRAKKAKCNGENPCLSCRSRELKCEYNTRSRRTKRSLELEIEELKQAQRQRDALIRELKALTIISNISPRLQDSQISEHIHETLLDEHSPTCPPSSQVTTVSSEGPQRDASDPLTIRTGVSSSTTPTLGDFDSTALKQSDTNHMQRTLGDKSLVPVREQLDSEYAPSTFNNLAPANNFDQLGIESSPVAPFETSEDYDGSVTHSNIQFSRSFPPNYDVGAGNWWAQGVPDPTSLSLSGYPIDPATWYHSQGAMSVQGSFASNWSNPTLTTTPATVGLPLVHQSLAHDPNCLSVAFGAGGSSDIIPPPPKRKKANAEIPAVTFAATHADIDNNDEPFARRTQSSSLVQPEQHTCNQELHCQALYRELQKQEQLVAELLSTKNNVEARYQGLQQKYLEVLGLLKEARSAL